MSTNYYFQIKSSITTDDKLSLNLQDYLLNQVNTELHIGKRSGGWRPLFNKTDFYSSVKEIEEFYKNNKDFLCIVDEYDNLLSWNDLKSELIDWNKDEDVIDRKHEFGFLYDIGSYYKDEEGNDFSIYEFY